MMHADFTLLTPRGTGAVATVAVRGPHAVSLVSEAFRRLNGSRWSGEQLRAIAVGHWESGEELTIVRLPWDEVWIHCHGGKAAIAAIFASLVQRGARELPAEEYIRLGGESRIRTSARFAAGRASTERMATLLLDQYLGALERELITLLATIESGEAATAIDHIETLLARGELGIHASEPWKVAFHGSPNAGKSSLMNALLGYERAIVFAQPGTTRDLLTAATALEGLPIELIDTAGVRETSDAIEAAGVALANEAHSQADLILAIRAHDVPESPIPAGSKLLRVCNKIDLAPESARPGEIAVSAITGEGIAELATAIVAMLVPDPPPRGAGVPFEREQMDSLQACLKSLRTGDLAQAGSIVRDLLN